MDCNLISKVTDKIYLHKTTFRHTTSQAWRTLQTCRAFQPPTACFSFFSFSPLSSRTPLLSKISSEAKFSTFPSLSFNSSKQWFQYYICQFLDKSNKTHFFFLSDQEALASSKVQRSNWTTKSKDPCILLLLVNPGLPTKKRVISYITMQCIMLTRNKISQTNIQ